MLKLKNVFVTFSVNLIQMKTRTMLQTICDVIISSVFFAWKSSIWHITNSSINCWDGAIYKPYSINLR